LVLTAVGILASLFLPWIVGVEEERYTVAGWEARPLFTVVIVLICLAQVHLAVVPGLLPRFPWAPLLGGIASLGMTRWVVNHNEYYEVPVLDYGIYVSAAVQLALILVAVLLVIDSIRSARFQRQGRLPSGSQNS
jgi:large-conductance mechanosensitive channel